MAIPIQNLYFLYCYAWRRFSSIETSTVLGENAPSTVADLWAVVLLNAFRTQHKRGLEHCYQLRSDKLSAIRGRINPFRSISSASIAIAKLDCEWDDFVPDTELNRLIKFTMRRLSCCNELDHYLAHNLRQNCRLLSLVSDTSYRVCDLARFHLHTNSGSYALLLDVCKLVIHQLLPTETPGAFEFKDPRRDEAQMSRLFQDFTTSWLRRHICKEEFSSIGPRRMQWPVQLLSAETHAQYIPTMLTDITLTGKSRTLIIDAKYYQNMLIARAEDCAPKIISSHLCQLFSYLSAWASAFPNGQKPEGLLLYPTVLNDLDIRLILHGFPVRVATLNLALKWEDIGQRLRDLVLPVSTL